MKMRNTINTFTIKKIVSGQYSINMGYQRKIKTTPMYYTNTHAQAKAMKKTFEAIYQAGIIDERIRNNKRKESKCST